MKKFVITSLRHHVITVAVLTSAAALAQNDSVLNRSVTVERDFQPVIKAAGKIAVKPAVVETTIEPVSVEYSDYTAEVAPEAGLNPMLSQPTRFVPGKLYNGHVTGGLGHPHSLFDLGYHLDDGKRSILDVYARHKGDWCEEMRLSKSKIGLDFTHQFETCDLYFGVNGGNIFYHRYGDQYAPDKPNNSTSLWTTEVYLGVKANARQDLQYRVQTGYALFSKPGAVSEHQLRTHASFDWHAEAHHAGANIYVQNNFMQLNPGTLGAQIADSLYNSRHNFRIEPYYAYEGTRVRVHAGVNLDLNIGCGRNPLSGTENISFAPSPNVRLEAQVAKQWLTVYADITGFHGLGNLQEFMETNRYRYIQAGITEHHVTAYTPVDAEIGFHIRPHRDLFIELHGGYARMLNQEVLVADKNGLFDFYYANYHRGKVGAQANYHYRDYVRVHLYGDYLIWKGDPVYDRPDWELGLRVDGRIDRHWSLYSVNSFSGSRKALAWDGLHILKPLIDLDLGLQYDLWVGKAKKQPAADSQTLAPEQKPNLTLFFQLENYIHRQNEIYYGYHTHGISFLFGATFRF